MRTILTFIICCVAFSSSAQLTTVWEENFIGYADNTGIEVNGGAITDIGDYNTFFTKWTLDASSVNLSNEGAGGKIINATNNVYNPRFVTNNTDGNLIWESESIDVSGSTNSYLSVMVSKTGDLTANDYVDVYWRVGNNPFILINNGSPHTFIGESGEECWETEKVMFDLTVTTQTTVKVRVVMNSNAIGGSVALDKVQVLGE